jgi:hypothetical protein
MAKTDPKHSTDDPAHSARRDGHLTVPRCVPKGRVLAHNYVRHWDQHPNTLNGFRWWTWWEEDVPENFVPCACGYAGLPHVAIRDHAERYKCETIEAIKALG